ncbi:pyrimidine monooxygenase RutA [Deinococcus seoulensis]|uniref:Pyrimidine monooxygenase RutA n=1 Tax=Deinococcus seoulensis TaxID=1837379 RepID=A0ABQ2RS02_9DEIO|nr:pyrimidine utilization protein A [Deinococcus seoulensis]GGR60334.1 pyrimidine monooxygenase RutA [Deinococcus seoulensis]
MDFGVFLPIGNNGWMLSATSPQYRPSFELNRDITLAAEKHGFEFVLSMVKLRGFGGKTEFWDYNLESFTLMAGLAAVTSRIQLYASVATLTLHPAMVARMAVTIDDISGGRFGINIVSGWNRSEYAQMGVWPGDEHYASRYDHASEYVQVMKELWRDGVSNFKGQYFQMDDCRLLPRPSHDIPLVCAGASERGMAFCAEHGHYNFMIADTEGDKLRAFNETLSGVAAAAGREIGTYALYTVILADTDEEARAREQHYRDGADLDAIAFMTGQASLDTAGTTAQVISELQGATFMGIGLLVGSPATVAQQIDRLAQIPGTSGMMLTFDDFVKGVERFGSEVMPLLQCRQATAAD